MKIEICFRDLKSLLHIDKVMNKSQRYLNKILAMVMLVYALVWWWVKPSEMCNTLRLILMI